MITAGAEIDGFRVRREIGRGAMGVVYEAIQLELDRPVALRLTGDDPERAQRIRDLRWPDHPQVVSMYAAGVGEHGPFVAMRLMHGSLADLLTRRRLDRSAAFELLLGIAAALDAAHAEGVVHGSVTARNVLLDERARGYLSDFGLGGTGASVESDRSAFAELMRGVLRDWDSTLPDGRPLAAIVRAAADRESGVRAGARRRRAVLAAGVIVLAAVVVALSLTFGSDAPAARLPAPLPGAQVLGSALPGGQIETVACGGGRPNGGSPACTIVQMRLPGRSVTAGANGAVLRWAVRGASGQLAVQVLRRQRDRFVEVSRSAYERADGPGLHVFRTALPIQAGDMVGLLVQSGAAIGVRRATVAGATTDRWLGPLGVVSRTADRGPGTGLDRELLLRVEYVPGASARLPGLLTGPRAASAPAGRRLGALPVELPDRRLATVAVVRLSAGIAIDLLRAGRRIARAPVADVNANGNLASLTVFGGRVPQLDWRNPDGTVVHHDYEVGVNTLAPHDRQ